MSGSSDRDKDENRHQSSSGSGSGQSVTPSSESEQEIDEKEAPLQEIPIGFPVDAETLKKLKAQAQFASENESGAIEDGPAQEENS